MKMTKEELANIIKEEVQKALGEQTFPIWADLPSFKEWWQGDNKRKYWSRSRAKSAYSLAKRERDGNFMKDLEDPLALGADREFKEEIENALGEEAESDEGMEAIERLVSQEGALEAVQVNMQRVLENLFAGKGLKMMARSRPYMKKLGSNVYKVSLDIVYRKK
jgi:hypothetical protein